MTQPVYPMKCRIRAQEHGVTRLDVYDDIGAGGWFSDGISAKTFAAQLADIAGPLDVHINSGGGDVGDGIAISNAIRAHDGPKRTIVDGMAASIASVIMQAGDERIVEPGSMVMIHDALSACVGNAADMEKMAADLNKHSDNLASMYATRAGGTPEQWRDTMRAETWYTAEEAVEAGLADKVGSGAAVLPEGLDLAAYAVPGRIAAQLRLLPKGRAEQDTPAADVEEDRRPAGNAPARVLGVESMPLVDKALPIHHTATEDSAWDGPAAVAAMPNDDTVLTYCHAWESDEAARTPHKEGDDDADDQKANFKFPHHRTKGGPANLAACRNGLARLAGADIPEADRAGVEAHLRAHLNDAGGDGGEDDGRDEGPHDHAGLPAWLTETTTPLPAWLQPAEEATK